METIRQIITLPSRTAIAMLLRYELGRRDPGNSDENARRGGPSAAEYAVQSIARQGLLVGGCKGCWRALCHRFGRHELDAIATDSNP